MKPADPDHTRVSESSGGGSSSRLSKRFVIGGIVFVGGFLSPALIPVVLALGLPVAWKTALAGGLAFGIPELAAVVAVAIMGREGFQNLKRLLWGLFKRVAPADRVSRTRYRIGLVMFILPILFAWLGPYLEHVWPASPIHDLPVLVMSDAAFIISFFVLGGEFWENVRGLFVWEPLS
jgi:hypothetical protein